MATTANSARRETCLLTENMNLDIRLESGLIIMTTTKGKSSGSFSIRKPGMKRIFNPDTIIENDEKGKVIYDKSAEKRKNQQIENQIQLPNFESIS